MKEPDGLSGEKKGYLYRVERVGGKKTRQKLPAHEAWATERQNDYDPNWRDNPPLEIDPRTDYALKPSLPFTKSDHAICRIRIHPGAPFDCDFDGDCPFQIQKVGQTRPRIASRLVERGENH